MLKMNRIAMLMLVVILFASQTVSSIGLSSNEFAKKEITKAEQKGKRGENVVPDIALRRYINAELGYGYSNGSVTIEKLESLSGSLILDVPEGFNEKIQSLEGLQYATNITVLSLHNQDVSDLSPISGLTSLVNLRVASCPIDDLTPLSGLVNLDRLDVIGCDVTDLSPISGLSNLTWLRVMYNGISDLSPISGFTNLLTLGLAGNDISDLTPLSGLTKVRNLSLQVNNISDLTPLSTLTKIKNINVGSNEIQDISVLANLEDPDYIALNDNYVTDISSLSGIFDLLTCFSAENQKIEAEIESPFTFLSPVKTKDGGVMALTPDENSQANGSIYTLTGYRSDLTWSEQIIPENSMPGSSTIHSGKFTGAYTVKKPPLSNDYEPTAKEQTVSKGSTPKAEKSIANIEDLPEGTTFAYKEAVDTSSVGDKEAVVVVTYPDESTDEVLVTVKVKNKSFARYAGATRFGTGVAVSKAIYSDTTENAIITIATNFPDALSGVPLAKKLDAPILLTNKNSLDKETKAELERLGVQNVWILGGKNAVSQNVEDQLEQLVAGDITRIGGKTRYHTSYLIAKEVLEGSGAKTAYVANGTNFPDALSAGAIAAAQGAPIILTAKNTIDSKNFGLIEGDSIDRISVAGGEFAISKGLYYKLKGTGKPITRNFGSTRYETSIEIAKNENPDGSHVYMATGEKFPDALTGSVLAANKNGIVLLTKPKKVPSSTKAYIKSKKEDILFLGIFGGFVAVSKSAENQLKDAIGID